MLLVDHFADFVLEISALLLDSVSFGFDFVGKGEENFSCFVEGLVVLLGEGVFDFVEIFEPVFD